MFLIPSKTSFCCIPFIFICVFIYIHCKVFCDFFFDPLFIHCVLFNFYIFVFFPNFFVIDFYFHSIVVGKCTLYDFYSLELIDTCFMVKDMVYLGKYSLCSWKKCVFCCSWLARLWVSVRSSWFAVLFKSSTSLLIYPLLFYLFILVVINKIASGTLMSTMLIELFLPPILSVLLYVS